MADKGAATEKSSSFLSKMRRAPRKESPGTAQQQNQVSFETLSTIIQSPTSTAEEVRNLLSGCDKSYRLQLLTHKDAGWTLFHSACQLGRLQIAFCLLELGADVNATTSNGSTGMHFLALLNKEDCMPTALYLQLLSELLRKGASLNHANSTGETCLHLATSRKNDVAVKFFAENGCDVNAVTKHGETALHYAVSQNCRAVIEILVEYGASDKADNSGQTAADAAGKAKNSDELLEALSASSSGIKPLQLRASSAPRERELSSAAAANDQSAPLSPKVSARSVRAVVSDEESEKDRSDNEPTRKDSQPTTLTSKGSTATTSSAATQQVVDEDVVIWKPEEADPFADESEVPALELNVAGCWEIYRNEFFGKRHFVFLTEGSVKALCVMMARPTAEGVYKGILVHAGEWHSVQVSNEQLLLYSSSDECEALRSVLSAVKPFAVSPGVVWRVAAHPAITQGPYLLALEAKLGVRTRICFGVVLGLDGQTKEAEMFENKEETPEFESFLSVLGEKIDLATWKPWRGTFSSNETGFAWYAAWRGFEFIMHVSTQLDAARQRQHIGNDTVLLFYKVGADKPEATFRGKVNACALVAQPSSGVGNRSIEMSCFYRSWIQGFSPSLPSNAISIAQPALLRDIIFTNVVNASYHAVKSGPYRANRLRLYDQSIAELVALENAGPSEGSKKSSDKELKSGWLMKRSFKGAKGKASGWKKRYCVAREDGMSYYDKENAPLEERKGQLTFSGITVVEISTDAKKQHVLAVTCEGEKYEFTSISNEASEIRSWGTFLAQKSKVEMTEIKPQAAQQQTGLARSQQNVASVARPKVNSTQQPPDDNKLLSPKISPRAPSPANPRGLKRNDTAESGGKDEEAIVRAAIASVLKRGLDKKGLFRLADPEVDTLVSSWKRGQMTNMDTQQVEVVAAALRKFAHEMEASLLTKEQFDLLMKSASTDDVTEKILLLVQVFSNATPVLADLFDLFGKVDQNSGVNKMSASNISSVFGPSFLREVETSSSLANGIEQTKQAMSGVQFAISHYDCCIKKHKKWIHFEDDTQETSVLDLKDLKDLASASNAETEEKDDEEKTPELNRKTPETQHKKSPESQRKGPAPRLRRGTEEAHARSAINKRSQSPPPAASTSAYLDVELDLDFDDSARRSNTGRRAAVVFSPRDAAVLKETAKEAAASRESDSLQRSGHVAIPGTRAEQPPVSSSPPTSARDLTASPRADAPAEVSSPTLERNADEEGPVSSPPGRPLRPHGRGTGLAQPPAPTSAPKKSISRPKAPAPVPKARPSGPPVIPPRGPSRASDANEEAPLSPTGSGALTPPPSIPARGPGNGTAPKSTATPPPLPPMPAMRRSYAAAEAQPEENPLSPTAATRKLGRSAASIKPEEVKPEDNPLSPTAPLRKLGRSATNVKPEEMKLEENPLSPTAPSRKTGRSATSVPKPDEMKSPALPRLEKKPSAIFTPVSPAEMDQILQQEEDPFGEEPVPPLDDVFE